MEYMDKPVVVKVDVVWLGPVDGLGRQETKARVVGVGDDRTMGLVRSYHGLWCHMPNGELVHIESGGTYQLDVIGRWMDVQGRHWRFMEVPKESA